MTQHQPWRAQMIAPDAELDGAPLLRKAFELDDGHSPVVAANASGEQPGHLRCLGERSRRRRRRTLPRLEQLRMARAPPQLRRDRPDRRRERSPFSRVARSSAVVAAASS
jgi:hypothetical protein